MCLITAWWWCDQSEPPLQVEDLIQTTLEGQAKTGFSQTSIEAALNTTEFHLRENNTGWAPA